MAARQTLSVLFIELAENSKTLDDPAPFCWPDWKATVGVETVPWHPRATAAVLPPPPERKKQFTDADVAAVQAFAKGFLATDKAKRSTFIYNARRNNHKHGMGVMNQYIQQRWPAWNLNAIFDKELEDEGLTMENSALPDLSGVSTGIYVGALVLT